MAALSRPARGGWIEMIACAGCFLQISSRPARGGWIEINSKQTSMSGTLVPPRKGRVD